MKYPLNPQPQTGADVEILSKRRADWQSLDYTEWWPVLFLGTHDFGSAKPKITAVLRLDGKPDADGNPPPLSWKDWPQAKRDAAVKLLNRTDWQGFIETMPLVKVFRPGDTVNVPTIVIPGQNTDDPNTLEDDRRLKTVPGPYTPLPDYDHDLDGDPNPSDPDDDNDGEPDTSDPEPQNPSVTTANSNPPDPEPSPSGGSGSNQPTDDQWADLKEFNDPATKISSEAQAIANGHAFNDHRFEFPEINTREEFAQLIDDIRNSPSSEIKRLERDRVAYWDDSSGTLVIEDPGDTDGGTAFRPHDGRVRFDTLE